MKKMPNKTEIMEEIVQLYQEGMGLKRLMKKTGLSSATIRRRLRSAGVYKGAQRFQANCQNAVKPLPETPQADVGEHPRNRTLDLLATLPSDFRADRLELHRDADGVSVRFAGFGILEFALPASLEGKTVQFIVRVRSLGSEAVLMVRLRDDFDHTESKPQWIRRSTEELKVERILKSNALAFIRNPNPGPALLLLEQAILEIG